MIEEVGTVISVNHSEVVVETKIKSTCGSCQAQSDCGTGAIARALTPRPESMTFKTDIPLSVGNKVRIGVPEEALLKASMWLYVTPLIALVGSSLVFDVLLPIIGLSHELWLVVFTLVFTFLSFVWLSSRLKKQERSEYRPKLLGVLLEPDGVALSAKN
jgi:sigma-E factor negative regulatory protein RseC